MFLEFKSLIRKHIYLFLGKIDKLLRRENKLVVYCYHDISDGPSSYNVSRENFVMQMKYLSDWGTNMSLTDMAKSIRGKEKLPKRAFAISFDDGYRGIMGVTQEIKKLGLKPTVYVFANGHNVIRRGVEARAKFLSTQEIKTLSKNGWEIGSHTISHWALTELDPDKMSKEVYVSKSLLEKEIKQKIKSIAYPHGKYNESVQTAVQKAGYEFAVSMDDNLLNDTSDLLAISRVGLMGTHSFGEFKYLASPSVLLFRKLVKKTFLEKYL